MTRHRGHPLMSDEGQALAVEAADHPKEAAEMVEGALKALLATEDRRCFPVDDLRRVYLRGVAAMELVTAAAGGERWVAGWGRRTNPIPGDEVTAGLLATTVKALTAALCARRDLVAQSARMPWPPQEHEAAMRALRARLLVAARGKSRCVTT